MKKFLTVLLAAVLAAGCFACGGQPGNGGENAETDGYDMNEGIDLGSAKLAFAGKGAEYSIVIPAEASECVAYAAQELSDFAAQATGRAIPVCTDAESPSKFISIGRTAQLERSGIEADYSKLNYDGFFIKTKDGNVYIDGANDRGRLYGVYDFLERFAGVRFVAYDCTHVPKAETLTFYERTDITETPLFRYRNYFTADILEQQEFAARMRMYSESTPENDRYGATHEFYTNETYGNVHNIFDYLREDEYPKSEYPEFYVSTYHHVNTYDDVCYSNGVDEEGELEYSFEEKKTVANIVLHSLIEYATQDPEAKIFMIGISDAADSYCTCPTCSARVEKYGGFRSSTLILFMNLMARELEKAFPDREIDLKFFAYYWSEQPPVKEENGTYVPLDEKFVLHDNLYAYYAPIGANYAYALSDSSHNGAAYSTLKRWQALTDRFFLWDYDTMYDNYIWYYPNLEYLAENIRWYSEIGVESVLQLGAYTSPEDWQNKLKIYVASKLYWHPDRNVGELVDEFIRLYYGERAAPFVRNFLNVMEGHFAYLRAHTALNIYCIAGGKSFIGSEAYSPAMLKNCISVLKEGMVSMRMDASLTETEKAAYEKRLYAVLATPQMMLFENYDEYYEVGKDEFAAELFASLDRAGINRIGEHLTLYQWKSARGYGND